MKRMPSCCLKFRHKFWPLFQVNVHLVFSLLVDGIRREESALRASQVPSKQNQFGS